MFEKEIKFIVDFNLNKIRKSGTFFTLDKLSSAGIHPSIVKYISAELDLMIYEDRKRLLNNSMFDYSGGEISKYFSQISREIKRNKRLEFEDLKKLVIQAVSFNANHVVRPRWSLSKLIFDPSSTRTVEEISLILGYPYYYGYTKNILISFLNKKKISSFSASEFDQLFAKIDQELFTQGNYKLLDNALTSMSDFFNDGAAVKDKLSPEIVLIFLKEKGLTEEGSRLRQSIPPDAKQKYNLKEIRSILYGIPGGELKEPPPKVTESQAEHEVNVPQEIIDSVEYTPAEKPETDDTFVKVVSRLPLVEEEPDIIDERETLPPEPDIIYKSEHEVAEDIRLPVVQDEEETLPPSVEIFKSFDEGPQGLTSENEIDLEREVNIILPDDEVKEIFNEMPEKEISPGDIVTDQDEIRFELEARDKLDELYEFEEEKEQEEPAHINTGAFPPLDDQEFNLNELENELKQIEEEFNIPATPLPKKKEAPVEPKKSATGDLFKFLSDKEIDRIISHIFNDDREDFTNTLERISECSTYEKSTEILKSVFLTYRINPYSRDAVSLTNAVSKYFDMK